MVDDLPGHSKITSSIGFELLAMCAFVLLALTVIRPIGIGAAAAGSVALIATRLAESWGAERTLRLRDVALGVSGFLVILALATGPGGQTVTSTVVLVSPLLIGAAFLSVRGDFDRRLLRWSAATILIVVVATIGVIWIEVVQPPEIDVLDLHLAAADVLSAGGNPYAEASAADTSPIAEPGVVVEGYPYPPLTMLIYAGSTAVFGDPRWAGAIAVAVAVLLMLRPWATTTRPAFAAATAIGLAVVLQPGLGHILRQGWTEPIALPLLVGAGLAWRRNPTLAAVLLGLTLGLKQYWIVAVPLLLVWDDDERWRRASVAGGVAVLTLLPGFVAGPAVAWQAMVANLLAIEPRADSIGLAGAGLNTPFWLVMVLAGAAALWMGRSGGSPGRFQLALAGTLATAFFLGTQAFVNYWFLIATMAMIAVVLEVSGERHELLDEPVAASA